MTQGRLNHYQKRWAAEKYLVMAHSQAHYNALRLLFKGNQWSEEKEEEFERLLKEALSSDTDHKDPENGLSAYLGLLQEKSD